MSLIILNSGFISLFCDSFICAVTHYNSLAVCYIFVISDFPTFVQPPFAQVSYLFDEKQESRGRKSFFPDFLSFGIEHSLVIS